MTPRDQAEQQARALWDLLQGAGPYIGPIKDLPVKAITEQLLTTQAACLEEAAEYLQKNADMQPHIGSLWNAGWTSAARSFAQRLREQAQARRTG